MFPFYTQDFIVEVATGDYRRSPRRKYNKCHQSVFQAEKHFYFYLSVMLKQLEKNATLNDIIT